MTTFTELINWFTERKEWCGFGSIVGLLNVLSNPSTLMNISSTLVSTIYTIAVAFFSGLAAAVAKEVFTYSKAFIIKKINQWKR